MSLRKTTILIIFATFTGLFGFLYAISNYNILSSFTFLEKKFVVQNLMRGISALRNEESELSSILVDWAKWDDTYAFVKNRNEDYIQSNLALTSFTDLRLNFILFLDLERNLVYGLGYDYHSGEKLPVPEALREILTRDSRLSLSPDKGEPESGVVMLPHGLALLAVSPIMTSLNQGPARGFLVMVRYLDAAEMERLRKRTRIDLRLYDIHAKDLPRPLAGALPALLRTGQFQIVPLGESRIYGFGLVNDIEDHPVMAMEASISRDIYRQGVLTLRYNFVALLIIGLSFGLAMLLLVEHRILSRITSLGGQIADIKANPGRPRLTSVPGKDEIASLSGAINDMLREIDRAHEELKESEHRYELATRAAKVGVWDWDLNTGRFYLDPSLMAMLGFEESEQVHDMRTWISHVHPEDRDSVMRTMTARIENGFNDYSGERRMVTKSGAILWIYVRGQIVRDVNGEAVRFVGTDTDITELKKAEENIRNLTRALIKAQESERGRIARDLHDNVAQDLSTLKIACETLFDDFGEMPLELRRKMGELSRIMQRCISGVRDLSYGLRPPNLEYLGLAAAVNQLCQEFEEKSGVRMECVCAGLDQAALTPDMEINVYRLIQEALNNVRKHAGASRAIVRVVDSYPYVIARIEDDGCGFDVEGTAIRSLENKRMGLRSMEERARLLDGKLRIESSPGEGTRIIAEIPYVQRKGHGSQDSLDH